MKKRELIFGSVSSVGVIAGIFFTACQLNGIKQAQISELVYKIQKDGRSLLDGLYDNNGFVTCVIKKVDCSSASSNTDAILAEKGVRRNLQFYSAIVNQVYAGYLPYSFWETWRDEMCYFLDVPFVSEYWLRKGRAGGYSDNFKMEVEACK